MQSASIEWLPRRDGGGYSAAISGFWGDHDAEGWVAGAYGNLHGIAVEPDAKCLERSGWLRVVRRRLAEQGVAFILQKNVQAYLDTEGAYWIDRWGGTGRWPGVGRWHHVRKPSFGERLLWHWKAPAMPMDRKLVCAGCYAAAHCGAGARSGRHIGLHAIVMDVVVCIYSRLVVPARETVDHGV